MPLGTIGKMMHSTRSKMLRTEAQVNAELFFDRFNLGTGDFIEIRTTSTRGTHVWKRARIIEIDACYLNSVGGYTAFVKAVPLNQGGGIGCTRRVIMTIDKKGLPNTDRVRWN